MKRTNLICGVGINDANYTVKKVINNKEVACKYYQTWKSMLDRCYSKSLHKRCPTYLGCDVADEWLSFMRFRKWMMKQDWQGKQLDKDIISPGNKTYSPDGCCFIPQDVNKLLTDSRASRGKYPQGVYLNKHANRYQAYIKIDGKKKSLGYFSDPADAGKAYIKAKRERIIKIANEQADHRVKDGLIMHAKLLNQLSDVN